MATRRAAVGFPKRGDVYVVRFDPTEGVEISKTRPAVIIQNDIGNRFSDLTIAAPITSKYDANLYPTEVLVKVLRVASRPIPLSPNQIAPSPRAADGALRFTRPPCPLNEARPSAGLAELDASGPMRMGRRPDRPVNLGLT
jgi:mRNA-degrading endonuclease toxin of MazEF toxin-antitoxin module